MKQGPYHGRRGRLHRHGGPSRRSTRSLHMSRANLKSLAKRRLRERAAGA